MWRDNQLDVVWMSEDLLKSAFLMGYSTGVYDGHRITNAKSRKMFDRISDLMADISQGIYKTMASADIRQLFKLKEDLHNYYVDNDLQLKVWHRLK